MRDEDARKEEELEQMNASPQADPFQRIFETNNMTGDEIPGFGGGGMAQYNDEAGGDNTFIGANSMAATAGGRRRRGARNTLSASKTLNGSKTAPSADLIKQRIAMRRGMSRRNQMAAFDEDSQSMGMSEAGYSNVGGDGRMGSKAVRRHSGIGNFVGEIKSIADPYEEASVAPSVARPAIRVHGRPLPQDQQDDTSQVISKYRGRRPSQEHNIGVAYRQSIADEPAVRESQLVRLGNELATQGGRRLSIESGSQYSKKKPVPAEVLVEEKDEEYDELQAELGASMSWHQDFVVERPWEKKKKKKDLEEEDDLEESDGDNSIASRNVPHRELEDHFSTGKNIARGRKRASEESEGSLSENEESSSEEEEEEEEVVPTKKKKKKLKKSRPPKVSM